MPKQILKNTANELAVKIISEVSETIRLQDGNYNGIIPSGYSILSIRWSILGKGYLSIERNSEVVYDLSGNGHWNFVGLADYINSDSQLDITYYGDEDVTVPEIYTLIIHLSKIA